MSDPICWRSECRTGCYYPGVCTERPGDQCHPSYHDLGVHAPTQTSLTVGQRPSERVSGETAVRDTDAAPDALISRPVRQAAGVDTPAATHLTHPEGDAHVRVHDDRPQEVLQPAPADHAGVEGAEQGGACRPRPPGLRGHRLGASRGVLSATHDRRANRPPTASTERPSTAGPAPLYASLLLYVGVPLVALAWVAAFVLDHM